MMIVESNNGQIVKRRAFKNTTLHFGNLDFGIINLS